MARNVVILPLAFAIVALLLLSTVSAAPPQTTVTDPRAAIGVKSDSSDPKSHGCTASIVDSPKGNIIVTAAHCVSGKSTVYFTPGFHGSEAPYGTWKSASIHIASGWKTNSSTSFPGTPYDYAFIVLEPKNGKNVAEVTGASLSLRFDPALPTKMQVFGYPSNGNSKYKDNTPYRCDSTAEADAEYWEILQCLGIPNGFSGGPWIMNGKEVFGVIGGKGQSLKDTDPRNYAVRFDGRVKALYDEAVGAAANGNQGYALGDGPLWKHASLITTGDFTRGTQLDMIVKWDDAEVTLYRGSRDTKDLQKPFEGETQLAAPHTIWTHAKGLATVNSGVVVTWDDGEVSYYSTVSTAGFGGEVQLAAPNGLWRDHASYIAGLGGNLVVVWSDGETSLYRDVAINGLHSEQQLVPPNETWTHARSISGGNWVNSGAPDLLVRRSDGEFTIYGDVASSGLGKEHQVQAPNDLWTHATVVAGRGNGIIVRWIDGELSFYPSVDGALHREIQLVAP